MRLLNIYTLEFKEFFEKDIPPYHILSHRWGSDEISYEEFCCAMKPDKAGYHKVVSFCNFIRCRRRDRLIEHRLVEWDRLSASDPVAQNLSNTGAAEKGGVLVPGGEWVWIDTCCIDKRSSAELTESINSMYKWYQSSYECIVLLPDVPSWKDLGMAIPYRRTDYNDASHELIVPLDKRGQQPGTAEADYSGAATILLGKALDFVKSSAWFTRGWTLQELIAPGTVTFCNSNWEILGHVCGSSCVCGFLSMHAYGIHLNGFISEVTQIPAMYLAGYPLRYASVAMRMSWASSRSTTRLEDEAYCLLGIFDVNMPMLYGEGQRAFRRLQLEIIQKSRDQSIFAWSDEKWILPGSFLATSPVDFAGSSGMVPSHATAPFAVTHNGLKLKVEVFMPPRHCTSHGKRIILACRDTTRNNRSFIVHLHPIGDTYSRAPNSEEIQQTGVGESLGVQKIYLYTGVEDWITCRAPPS